MSMLSLVSTNHFVIEWVDFLSLMDIVVVLSQQPVSKLSAVGLWGGWIWVSVRLPPLDMRTSINLWHPKQNAPPIFDLLPHWQLLALQRHHMFDIVLVKFFVSPSKFSSCRHEQHASLPPTHSCSLQAMLDP